METAITFLQIYIGIGLAFSVLVLSCVLINVAGARIGLGTKGEIEDLLNEIEYLRDRKLKSVGMAVIIMLLVSIHWTPMAKRLPKMVLDSFRTLKLITDYKNRG